MDSSLPVQGMKIQKISEGSDTYQTKDRISNLPDAILCHILSLLPTKNSVQTSTLAKRWKYLWVSVPNLDFKLHLYENNSGYRSHFDSFPEGYMMDSFTNFLGRLLVLRGSLSIQKFRLSCYGEIDFSRFYSWVCAAIMCNVRSLDLEFTGRDLGELPWSLFTCKTLEVLKIHGEFVFIVPYYVCLPNLKTLHLSSLTYLDETMIPKFLLGCPALEDLEIKRPGGDNMWTFNVSVPSLKKLTLDLHVYDEEEEFYHDDEEEELEDHKFKIMINAPNLEYLNMCDSMSDYIMVNDLPSVVGARVDVQKSFKQWDWREESEYGDQAIGLLRSISNVRRLSLSGYTLRSLSHGNTNLAIFRNLVHLKFGFDASNGPILLPRLLGRSPILEVLVFPEGLTVVGEREYDVNMDIFFEYKWRPPPRVPECLLISLKTVEIHRFCGIEKEELNLVKYLLENAMVLEKMTILCEYMPWEENPYNFKDELENYPRGSTNCQLRIYIPTLVSDS